MTTKEQMTKYLQRVQKWQLMAQGICDFTIDCSCSEKSMCIYISVWERDDRGLIVEDECGNPRKMVVILREIFSAEDNDKELDILKRKLEKIGVL